MTHLSYFLWFFSLVIYSLFNYELGAGAFKYAALFVGAIKA